MGGAGHLRVLAALCPAAAVRGRPREALQLTPAAANAIVSVHRKAGVCGQFQTAATSGLSLDITSLYAETTVVTEATASLADETQGGLASARRVLRLEAAGISALVKSLDERFSRALVILEKVTGRVIVTGMGKSGHVGRKIAATLRLPALRLSSSIPSKQVTAISA